MARNVYARAVWYRGHSDHLHGVWKWRTACYQRGGGIQQLVRSKQYSRIRDQRYKWHAADLANVTPSEIQTNKSIPTISTCITSISSTAYRVRSPSGNILTVAYDD